MSSSTLTLSVPAPQAVPRGAQLVALVYDLLRGFAAHARARRAAQVRAAEAEGVRRFARSVQGSDPGFASDLLAAADRHNG